MSWIIGRSAGSTQPSLGRVSLSLHSYQNPQFGMTINNIPLLEIKDFGPPARGGHFVLFHSFLPPQPYGTQFHTAHIMDCKQKKIRSKPYLFYLRSKRFELPTFWFVAKRSIQLSYERIFFLHFLSYKKNRNISSIIFNFM